MNDEALGVVAAMLALAFPRWLQRRMERLTFLDDVTIRHDVGVMFRWPMPDFFPAAATPAPGEIVYVPLDLGSKGPLTDFDCVSPDGSHTPILTTSRTVQLTSAGLTALIWGLSEDRLHHGLGSTSLETIDAIIRSPAERAAEVLTLLEDPGSELAVVLGIPRDEHNELEGLLKELAGNLPFLVPAPYAPEAEVVFRYSYSDQPEWKRSPGRLAATFGLVDMPVNLTSLSLGWSASYHMEIVTPPAVKLTRARLYGRYVSAPRKWMLLDEAGNSPVVDLRARRPTASELGHSRPPVPASATKSTRILEAARADQRTEVNRSDSGRAKLSFRPQATGTFLSVTVISALTAALLQAARQRLGSLDNATAAALLLALPVLILGFAVQPGEHAFATRLLQGVRLAGVVVGTCALLVAGGLAGGFIRQQPGRAPRYVCTAHRPITARSFNLLCSGPKPRVAATAVPSDVSSAVDAAAWTATATAFLLLAALFRTLFWPTGLGEKQL